MVMEEPPSPESVGREFVRQYYTLLNKAPIYLHRFYNNASSFIHGGLDASDREIEPVIGQKEIHNRIQQLNFQDCHAKISQVDSQATLGNGVVVQVTGELSNGGQPMRRFTQTFVLASQSPKQYYVHNDIFRYQDFVFSEEESEWGYSRSDDTAPQQPPPAALPTPYFPPPPTVSPASVPAVPAAVPVLPQPVHQEHATQNGHQEDQGNLSMPNTVSDSSCGEVEIRAQEFEADEPIQTVETPAVTPAPVQEPAPVVSTEPKTYANLVKSGPGAHFSNAMVAPNAGYSIRSGIARLSVDASSAAAPAPTTTNVNNQHRPQRRTPHNDSGNDGGKNTSNNGNPPPPSSGPGRRYSDSHQLFVGNLPHSATKEELRSLFEKFGTIVDVRVYSKLTGGPSGANNNANNSRVTPNYAFLTFEDAQSAQNCLNAGPHIYRVGDNSEGHQLNIQEKKPRMLGTGNGRGNASGGGGGNAPSSGGNGGGARVPRNPGYTRRPYQPSATKR